MTPHGHLTEWSPADCWARRPITSATASAGLSERDAWCSEQARRIQESRWGWLVMWSPWHRTFTAFSCFSPSPLVVDEPTVDRLFDQMIRVELFYSTTRR